MSILSTPTPGGWGDLVGGIANLGFSYALRRQELKAQRRMLRSAAGRYPMLPTVAAPNTNLVAPAVLPATTGAGALPSWATLGGGVAAGLLPSLGGLTDVLPGGLEEGGTGVFGPDLFAPTTASARQRMIDAPHPTTGERVFWRPVGRPILFSGDLALLKRTRKVIGRFATPLGVRRAAGRFRRRRC